MSSVGFGIIKKRIKSVNNTKKITNAMNLVATSKYRKVKAKLEVVKEYHGCLDTTMNRVISGYSGESKYILGNGNPNKLYIIITSDLGLCGSYNSNNINKAMEYILKDKVTSKVITMGQKGKAMIKKYNVNTIAEYVEIPDIPSLSDVNIVMRKCLELFNNNEVGEVYISYSDSISMIRRKSEVKRILPFNIEGDKDKEGSYLEFEPDENSIFDNVTTMYLSSLILSCIMSSKTCEQSYRMEAMDSATRNADDILAKLHTQYNRIRQSVITQEISEIVGGAEAQR
ncbi:MAG: ATP synthase F1 subunit gamma [Clostridium sp.]